MRKCDSDARDIPLNAWASWPCSSSAARADWPCSRGRSAPFRIHYKTKKKQGRLVGRSNWHRHSMALEFVWFGSWSLGASLNMAIIWQSWMAIWQSWQSWWHHARPCPSVTQCHREHSQCWKVMNHDSHDSVCKPWAKRIHPMQFLTWLIADKVLWFECFLMRFNASELNCLTSLIESNI